MNYSQRAKRAIVRDKGIILSQEVFEADLLTLCGNYFVDPHIETQVALDDDSTVVTVVIKVKQGVRYLTR